MAVLSVMVPSAQVRWRLPSCVLNNTTSAANAANDNAQSRRSYLQILISGPSVTCREDFWFDSRDGDDDGLAKPGLVFDGRSGCAGLGCCSSDTMFTLSHASNSGSESQGRKW
jgi:hypothetical protein